MGSKRLSDAVSEIVELAATGAVVNTRQAVVNAWDDVDADGQYLAGIEGMQARVSAKTRSFRLSTKSRRSDAEPELPFNLPAVVAIDDEGAVLLSTRSLSRSQFMQAISVRQKQIKDAETLLREWKRALKAADLFWERNPDWSFGQCLDAILGISA